METILVRIKTMDEMAKNHKVTIHNAEDTGHPYEFLTAIHDDSIYEFDEDYDGMLPADRIVELEQHDSVYIFVSGDESFIVDDWMIGDNYNA